MTNAQNSHGKKAKFQASKFLSWVFWALGVGSCLGVGSWGVAELTQSLLAQQSIPRFTSGVDVVQFTAVVLDKDRHPITGLIPDDFEVLVDGKPRPLAAFAAVTLPADPSVAAGSIPPAAPDVLTNQLPAEGRLVVIVMDHSTGDGQPAQAAHAIA